MKQDITLILIAGTIWGVTAATSLGQGITLQVIPSPAPSASQSPNFGGYINNAIFSIENGLGTTGNTDLDPAAYEVVSEIPSDRAILTLPTGVFMMWHGVASPPSPFENEHGGRINFGLHILGNGTRFKLANLEFIMDSNDPDSVFDFSFNVGAFGSFAAHRVGIDYVDGIKGNGNDIRYTSGSSSPEIDELVYIGAGNGVELDTNYPGATLQDKLDNFKMTLRGFDIVGTYNLYDDAQTTILKTSSATVFVIPEPSSALVLMGLGMAALILRRR